MESRTTFAANEQKCCHDHGEPQFVETENCGCHCLEVGCTREKCVFLCLCARLSISHLSASSAGHVFVMFHMRDSLFTPTKGSWKWQNTPHLLLTTYLPPSWQAWFGLKTLEAQRDLLSCPTLPTINQAMNQPLEQFSVNLVLCVCKLSKKIQIYWAWGHGFFFLYPQLWQIESSWIWQTSIQVTTFLNILASFEITYHCRQFLLHTPQWDHNLDQQDSRSTHS